MAKKDNRIFYERLGFGSILIFLIILISLLILNVHKLQGTARVVNYAGMVRGSTQRLVKLEIAGETNDILVEYVDDLIFGLQNSSVALDIKRIDDSDFQQDIEVLDEKWQLLKVEIEEARRDGYKNTEIIQISEEIFYRANEMVTAAEVFSQKIVDNLIKIEIALTFVVVLLIVFLLVQVIRTVNLIKNNNTLKEKAYIDLHTKLPNKSKCIELLSDISTITIPTAVLVFDINYLKQVNDRLGHTAGDTLIQNFASVLRTNVPPTDFVGRNGGDEFIAILYNTCEDDIAKIIDNIKISTEKFNKYSQQIVMSYSVGYDISINYIECNLTVLFQKADENMYTAKEEFHRKYKSLDLSEDNN